MERRAEADQATAAQLLPDDVLANVLGRLPPRSLAASRCACRAWRAVVDSRRLLPPGDLLLPRTLGGVFYNLHEVETSRFLAHPSARDAITGFLDYTVDDGVRGHCNRLLLVEDDTVANPATEEWASLPPRPPLYMGKEYCTCGSYLVYDPAVSPHYEVVCIPYYHDYPATTSCGMAAAGELVELPPSPLTLLVCSSRTGRWEEVPFLRQGDPLWAAVAGIPIGLKVDQSYSVYWQQEIYAYWKADSIMRISLSTKTYQLIQLPTDERISHLYLGKSDKGVYCALMDFTRLQIWFLSVSLDQMEWVLNYDNYLKPTLPRFDYYDQFYHEQPNGPWTLQEEYYYEDYNPMVVAEDQYEWDSDNDDVLQVDEASQRQPSYCILGFHPYKEVVFLEERCGRAIAFHWNSSKFQHLGKLYPKDYRQQAFQLGITAGFPYTPCWIDLLKGNSFFDETEGCPPPDYI
ncbi:unnamed protein product [Urochloa humidicola]